MAVVKASGRSLLESAAARPLNLYGYGAPDMAALVAARLFLRLNDVKLAFDKADTIKTMLVLAAGELSEAELADWFRAHSVGDGA